MKIILFCIAIILIQMESLANSSAESDFLVLDLNEISNWDSINQVDFSGIKNIRVVGALNDSFQYKNLYDAERLELIEIRNRLPIDLGSCFPSLKELLVYGQFSSINYSNVSALKKLEELHISDPSAYLSLAKLQLPLLKSLTLHCGGDLSVLADDKLLDIPSNLNYLSVGGSEISVQKYLDYFFENHSVDTLAITKCGINIRENYQLNTLILHGFPESGFKCELSGFVEILVSANVIDVEEMKWVKLFREQHTTYSMSIYIVGYIKPRAMRRAKELYTSSVQYYFVEKIHGSASALEVLNPKIVSRDEFESKKLPSMIMALNRSSQ